MIAFAAYLLTIPMANWLIGNVGTICVPQGPCLVPVGFGLMAPSGVLMVGAALVLRDMVQRQYGPLASLGAIAIGAAISWLLAPPAIVVASVAAFLTSEVLDFAVYTPLQRRRLVLAVLLSGIVGAVADSAVFLWLAFGSTDLLPGQVLGKLWMVLAALPLIAMVRGLRPADEEGA